MARLEPQYSLGKAVRDALVLVPIFTFLSLSGFVAIVSLSSGLGSRDAGRTAILLGTVVVFTGAGMIWNGLKDRYAATHNLRWSLNSRQVLVALSVVAAGVISLVISSYVYAWL
ncbi:MAG TPA: hypothetical protein VNA15_02575 [Candidatus Angelobacter sp.]|nr:hypothetical protein [Candidatus Angelobacter sp.]